MAVEVYKDRQDEWRWRYRARNGRITCDSSEGYASEYNARRAARRTGVALAVSSIRRVKASHQNGDH